MATETASTEAMVFAAQQANVSKARRQKFPAITDGALTKIADESRFHKFAISPLSPTAFPPQQAAEKPSSALRDSLLDQYLQAQERSPSQSNAKATFITLSGSGIAEALPTPAFPPNIGSLLGFTPTDAKPRLSFPKAQKLKKAGFILPAGSDDAPGASYPRTPGLKSGFVIPENDDEDEEQDENMNDSKAVEGSEMKLEPSVELPIRPRVSMTIKPPLLVSELDTPIEQTVRLWPRMGFSQDDSGLLTPPPPPSINGWTYSFESELPSITLKTERSIFDPPPAPCMWVFPLEFPASPRISGPSPLDTSLQVPRQIGSAMNSPITPEDRQKAAHTEAKPPSAPISDKFPVDLPDSPKRSGPSPIDTSIRPANRSDNGDSPTPTQARPPLVTAIQKSATKPAPIAVHRHVRFAVLQSPAYSNLRSPGLFDAGKAKDMRSPSPPYDSPVTPKAMTFAQPKIASATSPPTGPIDETEIDYVPLVTPLMASHSRVDEFVVDQQRRHRARSLSPPRANLKRAVVAPLPAKAYNPSTAWNLQVNQRTLEWACPQSKALHNVSYSISENLLSDRNNILHSYFNRASS